MRESRGEPEEVEEISDELNEGDSLAAILGLTKKAA